LSTSKMGASFCVARTLPANASGKARTEAKTTLLTVSEFTASAIILEVSKEVGEIIKQAQGVGMDMSFNGRDCWAEILTPANFV